jgi:hypothetical protein
MKKTDTIITNSGSIDKKKIGISAPRSNYQQAELSWENIFDTNNWGWDVLED